VTDSLNPQQFSAQANNQPQVNIYKAIEKCITELSQPNNTPQTKQMYLMFLIHFVGDAHQPMHVSRAIDKGGNLIHVTFLGRSTNLHSLWDGVLIQHDLTAFDQLAAKIDHQVSAAQIQKWQSDGMMQWLWESYQISQQLYQEAKTNPHFGQDYYNSHIPIAENRLEMAGVRLAGILNRIYH